MRAVSQPPLLSNLSVYRRIRTGVVQTTATNEQQVAQNVDGRSNKRRQSFVCACQRPALPPPPPTIVKDAGIQLGDQPSQQ